MSDKRMAGAGLALLMILAVACGGGSPTPAPTSVSSPSPAGSSGPSTASSAAPSPSSLASSPVGPSSPAPSPSVNTSSPAPSNSLVASPTPFPTPPPDSVFEPLASDDPGVPVSLLVYAGSGDAPGLYRLDPAAPTAAPVAITLPPGVLTDPFTTSGGWLIFTDRSTQPDGLMRADQLGEMLSPWPEIKLTSPADLAANGAGACGSPAGRLAAVDAAGVFYDLAASGTGRVIAGSAGGVGGCAWVGTNRIALDRPSGPLLVFDTGTGNTLLGPIGTAPSAGGGRLAWTAGDKVEVAPLVDAPGLVGPLIGSVPGSRAALDPSGRSLAVLSGSVVTVYTVSPTALTRTGSITLPAGWTGLRLFWAA